MVLNFDSYRISSDLRANLKGIVTNEPLYIGQVVKVGELEYKVISTEAFSFTCFTMRKVYKMTTGIYCYKTENKILKFAHSIGVNSVKMLSIVLMMNLNKIK